MRRYAMNFAYVRLVPPQIKFHVNAEAVTIETKIRFRMYAQLEEGHGERSRS